MPICAVNFLRDVVLAEIMSSSGCNIPKCLCMSLFLDEEPSLYGDTGCKEREESTLNYLHFSMYHYHGTWASEEIIASLLIKC